MDLIILTKSSKYGGYCVAGIDMQTHRWVRLVTDDESVDGALTDDDCRYRDHTDMEELDIVRVQDAVPCGNRGHQSENHYFNRGYYFEQIGTYPASDLSKLLSPYPYPVVLGNMYERISQREMNMDHSLELIYVKDLDIRYNENRKLKASFLYNGIRYQNFSVTDPALYGRNQDISCAVLAVSLGNRPYNGFYYKYIAKCYPQNR